MSIKQKGGTHTCKNCGHQFEGKVCNQCGEKVFHEHHLSAGHFFHEVIDFFYHFENKVLKTIWLNFIKPGFVTKENLRGVRIPYANAVQLYLVVNLIFYLVVSKVGVTDYIPNPGDHHYYYLSDYPAFRWTEKADTKMVSAIDSAYTHKQRDAYTALMENYNQRKDSNGNVAVYGPWRKDSILLPANQISMIALEEARKLTRASFTANVKTFGKTLIFLLLPLIALVFYLFFRRKLKYYGAALTLATHFMVYNLCFYSLHALINVSPRYINENIGGWMMKPFHLVFYNDYTAPVSGFVFGSEFEFMHLLFWIPWLFIAFRRLFNTAWWKNILASYFCSKIFFFLVFGVLKKMVIAITIWSLH